MAQAQRGRGPVRIARPIRIDAPIAVIAVGNLCACEPSTRKRYLCIVAALAPVCVIALRASPAQKSRDDLGVEHRDRELAGYVPIGPA
jgi:hypothetical protein